MSCSEFFSHLLLVCHMCIDSVIKVLLFHFFLSYGSKRLDESVHKLNKYWEAVNSKKQFQNDGLPNERTSVSHLSNMGIQSHQSITELANKKPEDGPKKIIPDTQVGTSAAQIQVSR